MFSFSNHANFTSVYMDPCALSLRSYGYHTDMYAFGIMMLVLFTRTEHVTNELYLDSEKIYDDKDSKKLKRFFADDWEDDVKIFLN